jgi:hypothetical protein
MNKNTQLSKKTPTITQNLSLFYLAQRRMSQAQRLPRRSLRELIKRAKSLSS